MGENTRNYKETELADKLEKTPTYGCSTKPRIEDCKEPMEKALFKAYERAIDMAEQAADDYLRIAKIASSCSTRQEFEDKLLAEGTEYLAKFYYMENRLMDGNINTIDPELDPDDEKSFLNDVKNLAEESAKIYREISNALKEGRLSIECENKDQPPYEGCDRKENENIRAWVLEGGKKIHICCDNLSKNEGIPSLAETILHEASHLTSNTKDSGRLDASYIGSSAQITNKGENKPYSNVEQELVESGRKTDNPENVTDQRSDDKEYDVDSPQPEDKNDLDVQLPILSEGSVDNEDDPEVHDEGEDNVYEGDVDRCK